MKGIVFNWLEEIVTAEFDSDVWDELLDQAGSDGIYASFGSYPDVELIRLVQVAAAKLEKNEMETWRWLGRRAAPLLRRYRAARGRECARADRSRPSRDHGGRTPGRLS